MNRLFKRSIIVLSSVMFLTNCSSVVDNTILVMHEEIDNTLSDEIAFLVASTPFLFYIDNNNYWYSQETTSRAVYEDEYQQGLSGLLKLKERVEYIQEYAVNDDFYNSATKLIAAIKKERKRIKEGVHAKKQLDFMFGDMGGFGTMLDAFDATDNDYNADEDYVPFPEIVKKEKYNLHVALLTYKSTFQNDIEMFALSCIASDKLSSIKDEQMIQIVDSAYAIALKSVYCNSLNYSDKECLEIITDYYFKVDR